MSDNDNNNNNTANKTCGIYEQLIFIIAIISGTACSICSKVMMELHGNGITGHVEIFDKPLFQTFGMFIGMTFGLIMHYMVIYFKIPFPGYERWYQNNTDEFNKNKNNEKQPLLQQKINNKENKNNNNVNGTPQIKNRKDYNYTDDIDYGATKTSSSVTSKKAPVTVSDDKINNTFETVPLNNNNDPPIIPYWMYFFLAIPSIFDLGATSLCMMGLRYLDVSIYQLLRGSGIIFVALIKQYVFGDQLYTFQWIGVFWNVISVLLVGGTAILNSSSTTEVMHEMTTEYDNINELAFDEQYYVDNNNNNNSHQQALWGVLLVVSGAFVQALQFVFEEKVMTMENDNDNVSAPPLLLIGMEGLWGTILCLLVVYPIAYYLPGNDHGSYEDPFNTYHMVMNTGTIFFSFVIYFFAIFFYNLFAVLVTYSLNSIWHAILDNFRPITVWGTDIFIFYVMVSVSHDFGEPWTKYSWLQFIGMIVLLYGTSVYNAPHAGSIKLQGQWYSFFINLQHEYDVIEMDIMEWEERRKNFTNYRRSSSMSPPGYHHHHLNPVNLSLRSVAIRGLTGYYHGLDSMRWTIR